MVKFSRGVQNPAQQLVRISTRGVELGSRAFGERNRDDFAGVGPVGVVAEVRASIRLKRPRDAAAIVHHEVGVLPFAAQFNPWTTLGVEAPIWPAVHPETHSFAIGREV